MFKFKISKPNSIICSTYKPLAFLLAGLLPTAFLGAPAVAEPLSNGQVFFEQAPRLVRAAASYNAASGPATYQFTLSVPTTAGAPLQAVRIAQRENLETVQFDANASRAFEGNSFAGGPQLSLASIGGSNPPAGEATVVFDPPIAPGKTVTVSLKAERNPLLGGIYLFGVTAYPAGNENNGVFLGYGRLTFIDP